MCFASLGAYPRQLPNVSMVYGSINVGGVQMPMYNLFVILAAVVIGVGLTWFLSHTTSGKVLRATAENRETSAAMGVNVRLVYSLVFTLGTTLSTVGGALVVPTAAASLQMGVELVVDAFAVIVIGGLGSMKGAAVGAVIVGLIRAAALFIYPEVDVLATYAVVLIVLIWWPTGLFGKALE
jgi:branched-chain amino acid transport system permease protein